MLLPPLDGERTLQLDDGSRVIIDNIWVEQGATTPAEMRDLCVHAAGHKYSRVATYAEAERLREQILAGGTYDETLNKLPR